MKLRTKLFQLGIGAVIPPLLLSILLGALLVKYQQDAFRDGIMQRNRAFMTAVDAEVRGYVGALRVLASSRSLEENDLREFYATAQRSLQSQPDWQAIILALPGGQQVLNTRRPFGAGLPPTPEMESIARVVRTGLPAVGSAAVGPLTGEYGIPVRIPYTRNGALVYVLTAVIEPAALERLIRSQDLPAEYVSGLVDAHGFMLARVPPRPPGEFASAAFMAAMKKAPEGWYRGATLEGTDTYTAHQTSKFTEWTVGLGIPTSEVNAAAYRAAWFAASGALLTFALAFAFSMHIGRRIANPIAALARAARALGEGTVPGKIDVDPQLREVRDVAFALEEAAAAIRERQQLIEREQTTLRAADRAKDEFLAMLGHELRNPLSAVSNAAVLLNRQDLSADSRATAHAIILRQTEQLTHLVNDLLDVGRVVAGKIRLEQAPLDFAEVAREAVAAIKATGRADAHPISVVAGGPVFVFGDRTRLAQVVTNLVSNAITFAPPNIPINVSVVSEATFAVLRVSDAGVGLDAPDLEAVFELFYQADKGLHRKGGLGIGLTLVKRIAELHGGTVNAASPGLAQGATFTVRLPAMVEAPLPAAQRPHSEGAIMPLQIVVIDDSVDARESMALLLESEGHVVKLAPDGKSGLELTLSDKPDVALIDIGMPGLDGYQVAREIRRQAGSEISLIAMTGYGQAEDVKRALEAGFDAHLVKPADFGALSALLAKLAPTSSRAQM